MKNSKETKVVENKELKELRKRAKKTILGIKVKKGWSSDVKTTLKALDVFIGQSNVNPKSITNKALDIRVKELGLKPISGKAKEGEEPLKTDPAKNIINRVYRILGGTILRAEVKKSEQSAYFNIETQTLIKLKFSGKPIDPCFNTTPQVLERTLDLSGAKEQLKKRGVTKFVDLLKVDEKKIGTLTKIQRKELNKFRGIDTTNPNDN